MRLADQMLLIQSTSPPTPPFSMLCWRLSGVDAGRKNKQCFLPRPPGDVDNIERGGAGGLIVQCLDAPWVLCMRVSEPICKTLFIFPTPGGYWFFLNEFSASVQNVALGISAYCCFASPRPQIPCADLDAWTPDAQPCFAGSVDGLPLTAQWHG